MAGPVFDVIVSLSPSVSEKEVSRKISVAAIKHGLGILFGAAIIKSLYEKEAELVGELAHESDRPLVFTVTSNPKATDAHEAFRQLNPWIKGAEPSEAGLLKFLKDFWNIEGISLATFLLYEELSPSSSSMPRHEMDFSQFLDWMARYYEFDTSQRSKGGAEGIFAVRKERARTS